MLLVCPTCEASYQIDDSKIGSSGRTVRCKKCATVWFATKPLPDEPEFTAEEIVEPIPAAVEAAQSVTPARDDEPEPAGWGDEPPVIPPDSTSVTMSRVEEGSLDNTDALPAEMEDVPADAPATEAIEHVAARSGRAVKKGRSSGKSLGKRLRIGMPSGQGLKKAAPYVAFAACLSLVFAVAAREPLARQMPWTGKLFAALGLPVAATPVAIANVRSELSKLDKTDVLIVEGELNNRSSRNVTIPPVRISVRDEAGTEIYSWSADVMKPTLQAGETSPFRARLASPPSNGRSIAVRFGQAPADSQDKPAPKKS